MNQQDRQIFSLGKTKDEMMRQLPFRGLEFDAVGIVLHDHCLSHKENAENNKQSRRHSNFS
jgi:hypothetical protein